MSRTPTNLATTNKSVIFFYLTTNFVKRFFFDLKLNLHVKFLSMSVKLIEFKLKFLKIPWDSFGKKRQNLNLKLAKEISELFKFLHKSYRQLKMFLFILHRNTSLKPTIQFLSYPFQMHIFLHECFSSSVQQNENLFVALQRSSNFSVFPRIKEKKFLNRRAQIFFSIYPSQPFIHRHKPFFSVAAEAFFRFQFLYEYSRYILNNSGKDQH